MVSRQGRQRNSNDQTNELEKIPLCGCLCLPQRSMDLAPPTQVLSGLMVLIAQMVVPFQGTPTIGVESHMVHRCPWGIVRRKEPRVRVVSTGIRLAQNGTHVLFALITSAGEQSLNVKVSEGP